jgi:outer membrane immunogenic protein
LKRQASELVSAGQPPDRPGGQACDSTSEGFMQFRRALTLAIVAAWGLGAQAVPAGAHPPAADDYSPYVPSGLFVLDWSGFYAGGHLGAANTNAVSPETVFTGSFLFATSLNYTQSENSVTGGVQAGWQRQWGRLVGGLEAGYTALHFDTTEVSPALNQVLNYPFLERSIAVRDILTFAARLGFTDGRWLAYLKGGAANAEVDVSYLDTQTGDASSSNGRETGWTAGAGIDYALTPNLFLGIEYNYIHIRSDVRPPYTVVPAPILGPTPLKAGAVDIDIQSLVVRLNYKFDACCLGPGGPPGQ